MRSWTPAKRTMALCALIVLGLVAPASAASITEFPLLVANSGPDGIAAGPDGNLWFTERNGSRFGRITPTGAVGDWSTGSGISAGSEPFGIGLGPDGKLWFAETAGNRVARISLTPAPVATEFSMGITHGAAPMEVTAGPDGNLWFSELNARIGRITPTGSVTEFKTGLDPNCALWGITAGPDGNLWFTQQHGCDHVGRITPAGVITEDSIGITPDSAPQDITAGPDGNLWFTENTGDRIGRITTSGVVTEFAAGISPVSGPTGITRGPDGNLWFTEYAGNRVARITPNGTVTEFSTGLSPNSGPSAITMGPDFNLWFTEYAGNRIGRLILDPEATTRSARSIRPDSARLAATIIPFGAETSYVFEYGRTTAYGGVTDAQILKPGINPKTVTSHSRGLKAHTVYHYRVVVSSAGGTTIGADRTFTTAAGKTRGGISGTRKRRGPRIALANRFLTFTGRGLIRISLGCPLLETLGCHGALTLQTSHEITVRRSPNRLQRKLRLGTVRFRVGGGQLRTVTITLSPTVRRLVRGLRRLQVTLIVTAFDVAGNRATMVKLLRLLRQGP